MARVLVSIVNLAWAVVAAVLLAAAILVTVVRLALPEISSQRELISAWISHTVGRPAQVGAIEAEWTGWVPRISVQGIALLNPDRSSELVRFARATIYIAPLDSIFSASLKPKSLIVSGVAFTLLRDRDGHFSVAGMPPPKSPLVKWLIEQDNFAVTDTDLTIIDDRTQQSFALSGLTLTVRNRDGLKLLSGFVDLPSAIGQRAMFELAADGDPLTSQWNGSINVKMTSINSAYLIDQFGWAEQAPANTLVDLEGWSSWREAQMQAMRFRVEVKNSEQTRASLLSANGRLERRGTDDWHLDIVDIEWPQFDRGRARGGLSAHWRGDDEGLRSMAFRGHNLAIEPLAIVAAGLGQLSPAARDTLSHLRPRGVATTVEAAWQHEVGGGNPIFVDVQLADWSSSQHDYIPALAGGGAHLSMSAGGGNVRFDNSNFVIDDKKRLFEPFDVSALSGALRWQRADDAVAFEAQNLTGKVNGTAISINGLVADALGANCWTDFLVQFSSTDAGRLHHLVPRGVLPTKGETWVRKVLIDGRIKDGSIALRGAPDKFPFRNNEGVFAVDFALADGHLLYSREWPSARQVQGHVAIRGAKLTMQVSAAAVLGAQIAATDISIADLFQSERFVHVSGKATGPATSATDIIMASPLKRGRAGRLAELEIAGDLDVGLDMDIALFTGGSREVLGQAHFSGNRVSAPKEHIVLDDFTGTVSFTRGDWYGEDITATFAGDPVGLVINGGLDDPNYDSEFRLTGTSAATQLTAHLRKFAGPVYRWLENHDSLGALTGELPWKAVLTIPTQIKDRPSMPRRLVLESTLQGLGIGLPWPLTKSAAERRLLHIEMDQSGGITSKTRIDFGDTVDAEIVARRGPDDKPVIERAEFIFGSLQPKFKATPGVSASGYIAKLALDDWIGVLRRGPHASSAVTSDLQVAYDLQVSDLSLFGNQFNDIRFHGKRNPESWEINVLGGRARGQVVLPRVPQRDAMIFRFEHLQLVKAPPTANGTGTIQPDPTSIPALDFIAESFIFGDIALGRAEFRTTRRPDGLNLDFLHFQDNAFNLTAAGDWLDHSDGQSSQFEIEVVSDTLSSLLNRFGYNVANIEGGDTTMKIDASWPGTPTQFTLARMAGNFEIHVQDGRVLDIDPGGGRLFGLLSLQTLPRRLSLDFSDLFRKGFAFDSIDGIFALENGNAYTNSLLMSGPSARIDVSGRTGLADQDYDQSVIVTPALSNSIPVAGALFGPIGIGAGAVYYLGQKMFKSIPQQIDKFLSRNYSVTGSWDNPSIKRL